MLPRHGYVSEDVPQIARLLFRIGGTRGQETLLEKFRVALAEMGIELVYTDDSMASDWDVGDLPTDDDLTSPRDGPTPRASSLPRNDSTVLDLAPPVLQPERTNSRSPMHYAPHRRRNSDSIVLAFSTNGNGLANGLANGVDEADPQMVRPHSSAGHRPSESQRKEVKFSDVVDFQSVSDITWEEPTGASTFDDIPFRPRVSVPGDVPNGLNGSVDPRPARDDDDGRPATRAENRPPMDFSQLNQLGSVFRGKLNEFPNDDLLPDEEFSSISVDMEGIGNDGDDEDESEDLSLPRHPAQREERHAAQDPEGTASERDTPYSEYDYSPQRLPHRDAEDETEMDANQIAFIASTEQNFLVSSFNHWRDASRHARAYNLRVETHAEKWDAWETIGENLEVWIQTALTMHVDENQGIQAYQEHMRQQESAEREDADPTVENVPPTPTILAKGSVNPRVRRAIERSRESLTSVPRATPGTDVPSRQHLQATEREIIEDSHQSFAPHRQSVDSQNRRLRSFGSNWEHDADPGSEDDEYQDASEELESVAPEEGEIVARTQYQIAAAAWDFFLMSKAFSHWANRADEEVQRTQIARRHILRRRYFTAWLGKEEKDETEAESKAVWFGQLSVLRQWRDVAVAAAKMSGFWQTIAERKERLDMAEQTLSDWYQESKLRLAAAIDSRRLRAACLMHWQAESRWLNSAHDEAEGIFKGTLLGRYMRHWKGEARIQERAEDGAVPIIARRDEFLRSGLALAWRHEAEEARNQERAAAVRELGELANHWVYETRLIEWREEQDAESLDTLTYHWYCEWRLVLCRRAIEQQEKARFLEKWVGAARTQAERSYHLRGLARDVRYHDSIAGFFQASLDALEDLDMQAFYARGMIVQRVVPKVVRTWTNKLKHLHHMNRWSHLAASFSIGETVLPHWQEIRRQEWKARMHRLYRDFRHRMRTDTVADCLGTWRTAKDNSVSRGWEADNILVEDDTELVVGVTDAWRSRAERAVFSNEVAEDADKEAYLAQWHSLVEVHQENNLDAAEFDYAQTAGSHWDEWTLASVAQRGRERTVHEFTGHNARRDQRHFFAAWASQTSTIGDRVPDMMDFRSTRRSARWTTPAPQRTRLTTDYTPFRTPARPNFSFRQSTTTPAYRPPSEMTFGEGDGDEDD